MPNSFFRFKQFTVWHDKCAMKVGTDGVLLGSWVDVSKARSILDVGGGTGLVSLMMAQRSKALLTALEIDHNAVLQAQENIKSSPWKDRIKILEEDYRDFSTNESYDLVVSNPPYFADSLKCTDSQRCVARHTCELTYFELIEKTSLILNPEGSFSLIIPSGILDVVKEISKMKGLYPYRQTNVHTKSGLPSKRTLITFSFNDLECKTDDIVIELSRHVYSEEYIELTKDYYLKM